MSAPLQVHFSNGLSLATLTADSVRVLDPDGKPVRAQLGSDIEGDVINIQPAERLATATTYTIDVTNKLIDRDGAPVAPLRSSFKTGDRVAAPTQTEGFQFTKTKIDDESRSHCHRGRPRWEHLRCHLLRQLVSPPYRSRDRPFHRQRQAPHARRQKNPRADLRPTIDRLEPGCLDHLRRPQSRDPGRRHVQRRRFQDCHSAAGSGPRARRKPNTLSVCPRAGIRLNGCTFGPDKRLYISVGSMNRLGHDPVRPETLLSSAVVVADVKAANFNGGELPLNVQTTEPVNYDPHATNAPLKLYATGFRQMYRVCWHSNGNLYGGVNQNDGTGRAETPSRPGVPSLDSVFPDEDLLRIVAGGYYGHPNPSRNQFVLLGGNPTADVDPWEVPEYPVGVQPESDFNPANLIFNLKQINGTSANGCCEYTLPGPLKGRLLMCFYEGTHTLHTFAFNEAGTAVTDDRPILAENNEEPEVHAPPRRHRPSQRPDLRGRFRRLEQLRRRRRDLGAQCYSMITEICSLPARVTSLANSRMSMSSPMKCTDASPNAKCAPPA